MLCPIPQGDHNKRLFVEMQNSKEITSVERVFTTQTEMIMSPISWTLTFVGSGVAVDNTSGLYSNMARLIIHQLPILTLHAQAHTHMLIHWPVLSNIEPPPLRRKAVADKLTEKTYLPAEWPLYNNVFLPPWNCLLFEVLFLVFVILIVYYMYCIS